MLLPSAPDDAGADSAVPVPAVALEQSDDGNFARHAGPLDGASLAGLVHVSRFTADEGLIDFDFAAKRATRVVVLHGQPNAMEHEPRGFLRDADGAGDFMATDAVPAVGDEPDGWEPLVQTKRGVLEDGPGLQRELSLRVAGLALPPWLRLVEVDLVASADGAGNPLGPASGHHVLQAVLPVGEVADSLGERLWKGSLFCGVAHV